MGAIRALLFCAWLTIGLRSVSPASIIDSYLRSNNLVATMEDNQQRAAFSDFKRQRDAFIENEFNRGLGSDLVLTAKEDALNKHIMDLKRNSLSSGLLDPAKFIPAQHFFEVMDEINKDDLFKIIRQMPKGGVLHAHDTALCNLDFIIQLTYWDHLWQTTDASTGRPRFRFSRAQPAHKDEHWTLVKKERERRGATEYDSQLRQMVSLYNSSPNTEARDINAMWARFMEIFAITDGILLYKEAWSHYFLQALTEFSADEVRYLEVRSTLPKLYDLDNNEYDEEDVVQIYQDVTNEYKKTNPKFLGAKVIYAPLRIADDSYFLHYLDVSRRLHTRFPDFVIGFDLVGQEDRGRPLIDFADQILTLPPSIKLYFHAGETNWNGAKTDYNLVDAILLGTKRIGHGYAIIKHPGVLEYIKRKGIAIEVNPISNQVLRLVSDTRNHPAALLFSDNYPVVVSSDDPSFWEAKPLSHDFYIAFLGIANGQQDLRFLKKLAMNSITYSGMEDGEKAVAMQKWNNDWDEFVDRAVQGLKGA